jgi:hypothetical protein
MIIVNWYPSGSKRLELLPERKSTNSTRPPKLTANSKMTKTQTSYSNTQNFSIKHLQQFENGIIVVTDPAHTRHYWHATASCTHSASSSVLSLIVALYLVWTWIKEEAIYIAPTKSDRTYCARWCSEWSTELSTRWCMGSDLTELSVFTYLSKIEY